VNVCRGFVALKCLAIKNKLVVINIFFELTCNNIKVLPFQISSSKKLNFLHKLPIDVQSTMQHSKSWINYNDLDSNSCSCTNPSIHKCD
jgi:hypothetical protein